VSEVEFTDRYQALGIPYPDQQTMCKSHFEGTGVYPQRMDDATEAELSAWLEAHHKTCNPRGRLRSLWRHPEWWYWKEIFRDVWSYGISGCDGWHFIKCADCNGTALRGEGEKP
jgi:sarcosine oxidase delta subunit